MSGCTHTFPLPDYDFLEDGETGADYEYTLGPDDVGVEDGVWQCPHESLDGFEKCVFHVPPERRPPDADATQQFVETVEQTESVPAQERRRQRQFVDATFETFDLRGAVVGDGDRSYIDLRHCMFQAVDCRRTNFASSVMFAHATFQTVGPTDPSISGREGDAAFDSVEAVRFDGADFRADVAFNGATFDGPAQFEDCVFHRQVAFDRVDFCGPVDFHVAEFQRLASFLDVSFGSYTRLRASKWRDYARFRGTRFDETEFTLARFGDGVNFAQCQFDGSLSFQEVETAREMVFAGGHFEAPVNLCALDAAGRVEFKNVELRASLCLADATVGGALLFAEAHLNGPVDFNSADIETAEFVPSHVEGVQCVSLTDATLNGGTLGQPETGRLIYDCRLATLGDVAFRDQESTAEGTSPLSRWIRFNQTTYDGFDFNGDDDLQLDAIGYELHKLDDDARRRLSTVEGSKEDTGSYETRWRTYLRARSQASELGDNVAASAFYYREMRNRRRLHLERAIDADRDTLTRLVDATRWLRNASLAVVTGYGEHPDRVLYSSIGMILFFTTVYSVVLAPPFAEVGLVGYLVLSLQSFVTFLLGSPPDTPLAGEVLTAIEGFLGAFLIALFVFTMTRRIRR